MLTVRLDEATESELARVAQREGLSKGGFVRRLLADALAARRETPMEAAGRLGLVGCIDGGATLSENRRETIRDKLNAKNAG